MGEFTGGQSVSFDVVQGNKGPAAENVKSIFQTLIVHGDDNMIATDKLDYDTVIEVAQNMGYDPKKYAALNIYINKISKMDYWDISRILFFGNQYQP